MHIYILSLLKHHFTSTTNYQFHKADKISLKMKAKAVLDKFIKSDPTKNDINTNWCTIKSILNNLLNDYVPYRTTKSRHNLPWITNEI